MAATPETKAKKRIIDSLETVCKKCGYALDIETHAGDAYSTPTLDITGTLGSSLWLYWGVPFAIEVKRFDQKGHLTIRQKLTMKKKDTAGVAVFLIDSEDSLAALIAWVESGCPRRRLCIEDL